MLTGTHCRSIDDKFRIAIPKRLRTALQCPVNGVLYVAPGTDRSLVLYTEEAFGKLAQRLAQAPPTRRHVRDFTRMFYGQAQEVSLDGQGRIRLPKYLVDLAQIDKEVMLLGVHDHVELWAASRWESYLAERQARYDEIAEAAFEPPGHEPRQD